MFVYNNYHIVLQLNIFSRLMVQLVQVYFKVLKYFSPLGVYRSRRDLYYMLDISEFRYKASYINGFNIHFDVSGYFDIS